MRNFVSSIRIIYDSFKHQDFKQVYRDFSKSLGYVRFLVKRGNRDFACVVIKNQLQFLLNSVRPVPDETRERAEAALQWLYTAQDATDDDGVSHGYFPFSTLSKSNGWRSSYPETTGYIIETLLQYATQYHDNEARLRALRMANWEVSIQMSSGAVQGGAVCAPEKQVAAVFNTGMVLQGYTAVLQQEKLDHILQAAYRAADYLVSDLSKDGHFTSHGVFVAPGKIKTYNCLCAWALYRFGDIVGDKKYKQAAMHSIEAAIGEQQSNGWFANNCLTRTYSPLLHTIAYTLQGILEVGALSRNNDFIESVRKGVEPILSQMPLNGFLRGRFYDNWRPATHSSCLTGNAQLAIICYRLFEITHEDKYRLAADRMVDYLKGLQVLDSPNPALNGSLAGSFPILWGYMAAGYPNWATKYFLDSLMLQDRLSPSV